MQISVKKKKNGARQKISRGGSLYRATLNFQKLRVNWIPSKIFFTSQKVASQHAE